MIIATQEQIEKLSNKYGESFAEFMGHQGGSLETMYKSWYRRRWLSNCFSEIDKNDDVVERIYVSIRTFADFFRTMAEGFEPVTQREVLATGVYGSLWTAQICVNNDVPFETLRFLSSKGITKDFKIEI